MPTPSRPVGNNAKRALEEIDLLAADSVSFAGKAARHLNNPDYIEKALAEIRANQERIRRIAAQIMNGKV